MLPVEAPWTLSRQEAQATITRHERRLPSTWWTKDGNDGGLVEDFDSLLMPYTRDQHLAIMLGLLASEISFHVLKLDDTLGEATEHDISRLITKILQDLVLLTRAHCRDLWADEPSEEAS